MYMIAEVWAITSIVNTLGKIVYVGKYPLKQGSSIITFLIPITLFLGIQLITLSITKNGNLYR